MAAVNKNPQLTIEEARRLFVYDPETGTLHCAVDEGRRSRINLGSFHTAEEAAEAYRQAKLKYHGEFTPDSLKGR